MYLRRVGAALAVGGAVSAAGAETISFAADTWDGSSPPFYGVGGTVETIRHGIDLVLGNQGIPDTVTVSQTPAYADIAITYMGSVHLPNGSYLHTYSADGTLRFGGGGYLSVEFQGGVLTALGSPGGFDWGQAAMIVADSASGSVAYTVTDELFQVAPDAALLGYHTGVFTEEASFALTLTDLRTDATGAPGVGLGADVLPVERWNAEASFSGAFIPGPGTAALLVVAAGALARRRR